MRGFDATQIGFHHREKAGKRLRQLLRFPQEYSDMENTCSQSVVQGTPMLNRHTSKARQ